MPVWTGAGKLTSTGMRSPYRPALSESLYRLSFFFFRWLYSPLWDLACRTIPLHFSLSITNSRYLLTPSAWRSLSTSSLHPFLGLPLRFVPSSSWVKIFLASYPPPFSPGDPANLFFAPLSILLYFLLYSTLLVLDSSYFSIPHLHIRTMYSFNP